ncbi:MAG TPA: hypothetical protein PKL15_18570 [Saprospiraceae bacterium]|nr:hypothetical protein [Saprospiraceae bacterium]
MRTRSFFLLLALLASQTAFSQQEQTVAGERHLGFTGIWGGSKHQLIGLGDNNAYLRGGFFGLEFGKSLFIGFGKYHTDDNYSRGALQNQDFDLRWSVGSLGYGFQNYKAVHPMINVDAGGGKVRMGDLGSDRVVVIQPSAGIEINIFRWFHLGLEGGYRFVTDTDLPGISDQDLSGAFGQATLKFGFSWGRYYKREHRMDD